MEKELSPKQRDDLLAALKARFEKNLGRQQGLVWAKVQARLEVRPEKLWSLAEMERTGGEPETRGAIYGDCRYNRVFIGHNGADSYYSGRGFRGALKV